MVPQKKLKQINKIKPGKIRGETLKTDIKYVEGIKGKKEAENIKKEMLKIEPEFDYDKIKGTAWYPIKWRFLSLALIKSYFNWDENDLEKMGHTAPSNSFVVKIMLRYFVSLEKTSREAPNYWRKHWSEGDLNLIKYDEKGKKVIYDLCGLNKATTDLCHFLKGYFRALVEMVNKGNTIFVEETKCPSRGDKCHRIEITWEKEKK
jgi:hypothetical protein